MKGSSPDVAVVKGNWRAANEHASVHEPPWKANCHKKHKDPQKEAGIICMLFVAFCVFRGYCRSALGTLIGW
jgi:hypothetical protein